MPFWPLGKPAYTSDWLAFGLHCEEKSYLAIWRITGEEECVIPLPKDKRFKAVECIYPQELEQEIHLRPAEQALTVKFPQKNAARVSFGLISCLTNVRGILKGKRRAVTTGNDYMGSGSLL